MGMEELSTCAPCHGATRWLLGHAVPQARLLSGACAYFCGRDSIAAAAVAWTHHQNPPQLVAAFKGTSALWLGHVFYWGPGCSNTRTLLPYQA